MLVLFCSVEYSEDVWFEIWVKVVVVLCFYLVIGVLLVDVIFDDDEYYVNFI